MFQDFRSKAAEFAIQEHNQLRKQQEFHLAEWWLIERNIVIVVGVIWGFLATHPQEGSERAAWWFPLPLVLFGCLRTWRLKEALDNIDLYMCQIEKHFYTPVPEGGVDGYLTSLTRYRSRSPVVRTLWRPVRIFWILLILSTVVMACIQPRVHSRP